MPLIILGLIVISAIIAYWYYTSHDPDDPHSRRDIGGKISGAAHGKVTDIKDDVVRRIRRRAGIYDVDYDVEDDGYGNSCSSSENKGDNTIPFPEDVEREKRRRDIH